MPFSLSHSDWFLQDREIEALKTRMASVDVERRHVADLRESLTLRERDLERKERALQEVDFWREISVNVIFFPSHCVCRNRSKCGTNSSLAGAIWPAAKLSRRRKRSEWRPRGAVSRCSMNKSRKRSFSYSDGRVRSISELLQERNAAERERRAEAALSAAQERERQVTTFLCHFFFFVVRVDMPVPAPVPLHPVLPDLL
jgi:hypothetical protein